MADALDPAPVLAFAMRPGADLDAAPYRHRRRLEVQPSPSGLAAVALPAADLALLRPDLADLRIVDEDGAQWPYLLRSEGRTELAQACFAFLPTRAKLDLQGWEAEDIFAHS